MRLAAIILGRAGSKGVPGKNTRDLAGKPCVVWTIEAALGAQRAGAVALVGVSTDDESLRAIAAEHGVVAVPRPAALAHDTARVDDAARHALLELEGAFGRFDGACILYANVPVRPEGVIERACRLLAESGADSVQSFQPVGKHHPWWTCVVEGGGGVRPWEGNTMFHGVFRRQDLPPAHSPDGAVMVVSRAALMLQIPGAAPGPHAFLGVDRRGIVNAEGSVVDIDSELDVHVASSVLAQRLRDRGA